MRVELYNLKDDLGETRDLARDKPETAARLRNLLHRWRRSLDAQMPTRNPNYKPAEAKPQQAELTDPSLLLRMAQD